MSNTKQPKNVSYPFTVDSEFTQEMPTVGRLLNRKTFTFSTPSAAPSGLPSAVNDVPPLAADPRLPTPINPLPTGAVPSVQQSGRRNRQTQEKIGIWDLAILRQGKEPFCASLADLADPKNGATSALFLCVDFKASSVAQSPRLAAHSAIGTREQLRLWSGLRWDPASIAAVWEALVKNGFAEAAPGTENSLRETFGIGANEWMSFVQVGPAEACRGIALVTSPESMRVRIAAAVPRLTAALGPTKNAA